MKIHIIKVYILETWEEIPSSYTAIPIVCQKNLGKFMVAQDQVKLIEKLCAFCFNKLVTRPDSQWMVEG
jgi:hypothetical protein